MKPNSPRPNSVVRVWLLLIAAPLLGLILVASDTAASPALQFPWPTGTSHQINGQNCTYNCAPKHFNDNANALDFEFVVGDLVTTVASGQISDGTTDPIVGGDRGLFLEIDHGNGHKTRYLHLRSNAQGGPWAPGIGLGSWVPQGQHIAYSGDTGNVPAHLHFDLKVNGQAHLPEPMSGLGNFGQWGAGTGQASGPMTSRPVRWPTGNFYTASSRADVLHQCCGNYLNTWQSTGSGTFTVAPFTPPGGNYDMNSGTWLNGLYDSGTSRDLAHLCCTSYMNTWRGNGAGSFIITQFTPSGGYLLQQGSWHSGKFINSSFESLVHICCTSYLHTWISNGNGTWLVGPPQGPPGYGMQQGSWKTGDFNGDTYTDLLHFCCSNYVNV